MATDSVDPAHIDDASSLPLLENVTLNGHTGSVASVSWNTNGEYCVSCGYDKTIRLWNPYRNKCIKIYRGHGYQVVDVVVNKDNSQLASCGGDKTPFLWDVQSGKVLRKFKGHDSEINCLRFEKECNVLVSGGYDKTTKIWDIRSRNFEPIQVLCDAKDSISSIFIAQYEIVTGSIDKHVRTYDIRIGQLRTDAIGKPVSAVSLSKDEKVLLVGTLDNTIRLFDKDDGSLLVSYTGHKNVDFPVGCVFNNADAFVGSGSEDGNIFWWGLEEGKLVHQAKAHESRVSSLSYHPTRPYMLSTSADKTIKLWGRKKPVG